ncbi:MAG: hypothetical protein Q4G05_06180 [Clostridia bacterium]|nr:hypothetical protein [Clostridia bacterium]
MKTAYFYINGSLLNSGDKYDQDNVLELDKQYIYEINNYGVSKKLDKCKYGAICDAFTTVKGERNIVANSYVAIFEINISNAEFKTIDEEIMLADFDILDFIKNKSKKLIYSGMFNKDKKFVEDFIKI